MTIQAKLNIASLATSAMMLLNVFSKPLGIPSLFQWVLIFGVWIPIGLMFSYIKKLKEENAIKILAQDLPKDEEASRRKKIKTRLIMLWALGAAVGFTAPLWSPLTGHSLGKTGDFVCGLVTVIVVSVIYGKKMKKIGKP